MKIGVNTFGLGPWLYWDAATTWKRLWEGGVRAVEPCVTFRKQEPQDEAFKAAREKGIFGGSFPKAEAANVIAALRDRGFDVFGFQMQDVPFTMEGMSEALVFMARHDLHYGIYSFMDGSVEKIRTLAPVIRKAAALYRQNGRELLIHNHDMEWDTSSGTSVMAWLLENVPELRFEIDLGWTEYAGVSSVDLLENYPDRFPLLHIKEIAKGAKAWTDAPFCTAPGQGILPLQALVKAARKMPLDERAWIIDQDNSISGDIVADIAQGVHALLCQWRVQGDTGV
ncbi:MAG TPA: sugar phosphate isomerase/epimerase [Candidatus Fimivicinus intestinavium]|nr:sugar phosphate isomerase/epimerase [Candidatus Fimivicinus intestinavium]